MDGWYACVCGYSHLVDLEDEVDQPLGSERVGDDVLEDPVVVLLHDGHHFGESVLAAFGPLETDGAFAGFFELVYDVEWVFFG